jgi:hypothetical protein
MLRSDICDYYSWFIWKRHGLKLNRPIRGPHVSFINDHVKSINSKWNETRQGWNNKKIKIELNLDARTDGEHWWLNVTENSRHYLTRIRNLVGLGRPYYGMHMSIGRVRDLEEGKYVQRMIERGNILNEN